jgi:uncharacterized protein (TIGR00730 family)
VVPADEKQADDRQDDSAALRQQEHVDDLIHRIKQSADRLAADKPSRGDLKILSRTLRELRYAFKVFAPYRNQPKVSVFGSARTQPHEATYQQAVAFGKAMAEHEWFIVTGAAQGIMEAGHVGAGRDRSMGLNIMLPFEQEANSVIAGDHKLVNMKYFFTRKLMFVKECDGVVCLPGGFGTLDEALEVLTLLQTGKRDMVPVVLLDAPGGSYWSSLDSFFREELLKGGMIAKEDRRLYLVTSDYQEAVDEVIEFFRVFHSMRFVGDRLVLRLKKELTEQQLAELTSGFGDILKSGEIEQRGPFKAESNEPELDHLSRLVFHFNRRSHGRLRMMIDQINGRPDRG